MNQNLPNNARTQSPCIGQCCLDEQDLCVGCFRTMDQIVTWATMSNEQRDAVLVECKKRKEIRPNFGNKN